MHQGTVQKIDDLMYLSCSHPPGNPLLAKHHPLLSTPLVLRHAGIVA
jgi:hypothetical protein